MLPPLCIAGKCHDFYAYCKEWCVCFETAVIVQGHYFIRQLWVGILYQLVYCICIADSGDFSCSWWSWGRKWQTVAVRWNEDPVYYGVRQIQFFFQWDDKYNPDRHNFNSSVNEYGEVLEGSTCDMCNTKISGGTYKIFTVQETKTCSGYKCITMGSTQKSSANKTWKKVNMRCKVPSMMKTGGILVITCKWKWDLV